MKCQYCGKEIDGNSSFCKYCGNKQEYRQQECIYCKEKNEQHAVYCRKCGKKLETESEENMSVITQKINRKKIFIISTICVLLVFLLVIWTIQSERKEQEEARNHKEMLAHGPQLDMYLLENFPMGVATEEAIRWLNGNGYIWEDEDESFIAGYGQWSGNILDYGISINDERIAEVDTVHGLRLSSDIYDEYTDIVYNTAYNELLEIYGEPWYEFTNENYATFESWDTMITIHNLGNRVELYVETYDCWYYSPEVFEYRE